MGNGADETHLPPARNVADDHAPVRFEAEVAEPEPQRKQRNRRITDADKIGVGSLKQKCRNNLAAIELLLAAEAEGKLVPPDERPVLVRYVGWGGLPQVFDAQNDEWKTERERLEALLTSDELESARATTLNAHYISLTSIRAMFAALKRFGFEHGRVLEPACGLGHFIGLMPDEMHSRSHITGIEIDSITAQLAKALYHDADIRHHPFEEAKLADGCRRFADHWHAAVRLDSEVFHRLKAKFGLMALTADAERLEQAFRCLPVEPYAAVRRQLFELLRSVNHARLTSCLEPIPFTALRLHRRSVVTTVSSGATSP